MLINFFTFILFTSGDLLLLIAVGIFLALIAYLIFSKTKQTDNPEIKR